MPQILRQKKFVAVGIVFALLASAGAYAYWTQAGAGSGTATHATSQAVVVNQATIDTLYPGVTVPLSGTFTNPNPGVVTVSSVTATIASITDPTPGSPVCTVADYEFVSGATTTTVSGVIATGPANGTWSGLSIRMINSAGNQDSCKDATVNLTYTSA